MFSFDCTFKTFDLELRYETVHHRYIFSSTVYTLLLVPHNHLVDAADPSKRQIHQSFKYLAGILGRMGSCGMSQLNGSVGVEILRMSQSLRSCLNK
jgi:hypothetical protein